MIITRLQGGLGNQMFQYAAGRAKSLREGVPLLLDTTWYNSQDLRSLGITKFNIEAQIASPAEISAVSKSNFLDGYFQNESYFNDAADVIRKDFQLKDQGDPKLKEWLNKIQKENSVSLHIRRTDYLAPKHQTIYRQISLEYYKAALKYIQGEVGAVQVFVFSDDIEWVKKNLIIPSDIAVEYISDKGFSPEQELFLMSQCSHNITANSTFSWWAAWLNPNLEKIVVTPKKWFFDSKENRESEIIPSSWIQIDVPEVTVLMPVYNGEKYLCETIESILGQSFTDFEFLIIDDGSKDKSAEIIFSFDDPRIRYVKNETNKGLPTTLNIGIDLARGEYIARMDADDISLPERLHEQVSFMRSHPEIAVCGAWIRTIGRTKSSINKYFTDSEEIRASLLFNTSLAHPSVMIRKSMLTSNNLRYDPADLHFEDYDLWVRLCNYGKLANIPKVVLLYRVHASSVSRTHSGVQKKGAGLVQENLLKTLQLTPTEEDIRIHRSIRPQDNESLSDFLLKEEIWLKRIIEANNTTQIYETKALSKVIYTRWETICGINRKGGMRVYSTFKNSPLSHNKTLIDSLKMFIKCLI